jgi:hypothetical protein
MSWTDEFSKPSSGSEKTASSNDAIVNIDMTRVIKIFKFNASVYYL